MLARADLAAGRLYRRVGWPFMAGISDGDLHLPLTQMPLIQTPTMRVSPKRATFIAHPRARSPSLRRAAAMSHESHTPETPMATDHAEPPAGPQEAERPSQDIISSQDPSQDTPDAVVEHAAENSVQRRVKVYEMDAGGQWLDKGTGHVMCIYVEAKEGFCLVVRSEQDGAAIMNTRIRTDAVYARQQAMLIIWSEPDKTDLALSFQEAAGCEEMHEQIQELQRRMAADKHDIDQMPLSREESRMEDTEQILTELPPIELKNLAETENVLRQASCGPYIRDQLARNVTEMGVIDKLLPMLEICEDLESSSDLFSLSSIMRSIIFLNDQSIYEHILKDDVFPFVIGILEYDKEFPHLRADHRGYFKNSAKFKEVVPIKDPQIVDRIKQTYRVQYLKDVVLARVLDDQTFSAFNSIVYFNHVEVVEYFRNNDAYLSALFETLSRDDTMAEKRKDVILFLHELSTICRGLQKIVRFEFYRALGQHGLFALFEYTLGEEDNNIRVASISILHNILDHDPSLVRSFCLAQVRQNHRPLIDFMIERFHEEQDLGLQSQMADCLRLTLDTTGIDTPEDIIPHAAHDTDVDGFLRVFYEKHCEKLFSILAVLEKAPTVDLPDGSRIIDLSPQLVSICGHLCELLCFVITHHAMFSKHFLLQHDALHNVSVLFKARHMHLRLSALRVFRHCIGTNEEFYRRLLIKKDIFGPIFVALLNTKGKYNLLNSACLEFFDYIRKATGFKQLIAHIVSTYRKYFDALNYTQVFEQLVAAHDRATDASESLYSEATATLEARPSLRQDGWSALDADEEAYFNTEDDDDDEIAAKVDADDGDYGHSRNKRTYVGFNSSNRNGGGQVDDDHNGDSDNADGGSQGGMCKAPLNGLQKATDSAKTAVYSSHPAMPSSNPRSLTNPSRQSFAHAPRLVNYPDDDLDDDGDDGCQPPDTAKEQESLVFISHDNDDNVTQGKKKGSLLMGMAMDATDEDEDWLESISARQHQSADKGSNQAQRPPPSPKMQRQALSHLASSQRPQEPLQRQSQRLKFSFGAQSRTGLLQPSTTTSVTQPDAHANQDKESTIEVTAAKVLTIGQEIKDPVNITQVTDAVAKPTPDYAPAPAVAAEPVATTKPDVGASTIKDPFAEPEERTCIASERFYKKTRIE